MGVAIRRLDCVLWLSIHVATVGCHWGRKRIGVVRIVGSMVVGRVSTATRSR